MKKLLTGFILVISLTNIFSQSESLITDRPDITESAFTVPFKSLQVESGFTYMVDNPLIGSLGRYGISDAVELRLGADYYDLNNDLFEGEFALLLGSKFQLIKNDDNLPDAALLTHLLLREADGLFDSDNVSLEAILSASHNLGLETGIGYNAGINWNSAVEQVSFIYSSAVGFPLTNELGAFIEIFGEAPEFEFNSPGIDGGFYYLIDNNLQIDLAGGFTNIDDDDFFIVAGISFRTFFN